MLLVLAACGGKEPPPKVVTPRPAPADAGAPVDAAVSPSTAAITSLPDAMVPPPYQLTSARVERRPQAGWAACHARFTPGADPSRSVAALAQGCAKATGTKPARVTAAGSLKPTSTAVDHRFHAEAGRCYRVYGVASPGIKNLVVLVLDSTGATAAQYHTDPIDHAIAPDEAVCFKQADDATLAVSVGDGEGAYAVQLWAR